MLGSQSGTANLARTLLVPFGKARISPIALVRTTTSNLIAVGRLLVAPDDPDVCGPAATLPPAPQTSHDVDALAAAQRDRSRTNPVTPGPSHWASGLAPIAGSEAGEDRRKPDHSRR
jgi:hypothetical protein